MPMHKNDVKIWAPNWLGPWGRRLCCTVPTGYCRWPLRRPEGPDGFGFQEVVRGPWGSGGAVLRVPLVLTYRLSGLTMLVMGGDSGRFQVRLIF